MATIIRPELSANNKYFIDKHRYYELKHYCLQYMEWKKKYAELEEVCISTSILDRMPSSGLPSDLTAKYVEKKLYYSNKITLVESVAKKADPELYLYILKAVTEDLSFVYLKTKLGIPCGKDMYYDRYRRFFWMLSKERN